MSLIQCPKCGHRMIYGMQTYEAGNTDGGKNLAVKIKPMNQ